MSFTPRPAPTPPYQTDLPSIVPIADRPRCAACDKALSLFTYSFEWPANGKPLPPIGAWINFDRHNLSQWGMVRMLTPKKDDPGNWMRILDYHHAGKPSSIIRPGFIDVAVWCGHFHGYVQGVRKSDHEEWHIPLFCSTRCATRFAAAAYRGGYRMKGRT